MNESEREKRQIFFNRFFAILKLIVLIVIIVGVPLWILIFHREFISDTRNSEKVLDYLRNFNELKAALIYMAFEIVQIVVCILPGQVFQIAAGYVFGFIRGLIYSIPGIIIGTTFTYYIAKLLGEDAMLMLFGKKRTDRYKKLLNSEKAYIVTFIIYLIPGLPKDLTCYVAGISNIKFKPFLIISTAGRIPAMCGSLLFGHFYLNKNNEAMIILAILVLSICIICFFKRKKIKEFLDTMYEKIS